MSEVDRLGSFRATVRAFIAEALPADIAARGLQGFHSSREDQIVWGRVLHAKGWSAPAWPVEYGGQGWTAEQLQIFDEECYRAGAPENSWNGTKLVGPVIYTFGSEVQKQRFLPPILSWDVFWGQGFSEPDAGSDLASLKTRGVRVGEDLIVNGSKTWMTDGHFADWLFCLVRTLDTPKPQQGISFLLIDRNSPGVEMRPIASIDGQKTLNEVFFTDVRVPLSNLVGQEGQGWSYAKFLLGNERTSSAEVPRCKYYLRRLIALSVQVTKRGRPICDDPLFRNRLATIESELMALDASVRILGRSDASSVEFARFSVLKLKGSHLLQAMTELMTDMIGEVLAYRCSPYDEPEAEAMIGAHVPGITADFLYRRASTIYGGAAEIQRNIIASSLLPAVRQ